MDQALGLCSPLHLWMTWLDNWELLREASTALAAPRGTAETRKEQKSTVSLLLFQTSEHHSVFLTPLVLHPAASHQPGDTVLKPRVLFGTPHGSTTRQEMLQGFTLKARASKSQILHS